MKNREFLTMDKERIYFEIRKIMKRMGLDEKEY